MIESLRVTRSSDGNRLYEKVFFEDKIKFQYPPTSLVTFAALDAVGLTSPRVLDLLNIAAFGAGCVAFCSLMLLLLSKLPPPSEQQQWSLALLLLLVALLHYPSVQALKLGQIQVWINTLFTLACIAWVRGAKTTAGALLAFAATIKPQLGVFLIWALLWGEWSFLRGFLAVGLPIGVLSLLLFGIHNHVAYLDVLSFLSRHGEAYFANQSVNGLMHRALGNGINLRSDNSVFAPADIRVIAATFFTTLIFLAIALVPALLSGQRRPDIIDFAITAICATLASPIAWEHHYGGMLPLSGVALVMLCATAQHRAVLPMLIASWVLSTNFLPAVNYLSDTPLNVLQSYLFFAALILLGVLIYLRRQNGPPIDGLRSDTAGARHV